MPSTRARTILRAVSRDDQRAIAQPNPGTGKNRAERRKHAWRGDISAQLAGPHPMRRHFGGLLLGRAIPTSGQVRTDAKRTARAAYWAGRAEPEPIVVTIDGAELYHQLHQSEHTHRRHNL